MPHVESAQEPLRAAAARELPEQKHEGPAQAPMYAALRELNYAAEFAPALPQDVLARLNANRMNPNSQAHFQFARPCQTPPIPARLAQVAEFRIHPQPAN